jgi:hypothetical protein
VNDWIKHRRSDGELLGWIRQQGVDYVIIDRLGREDPTPRSWVEAEECLEDRGLGWLAEPYELVRGSEVLPVRITAVGTDGIEVKGEDYGDIRMSVETYRLPFPAPASLRHRSTPAGYWAGGG